MVHNWSLPLEFSTEQLKNFADEVRIVLGEKKVCSALIFFYFLFLKGIIGLIPPAEKQVGGVKGMALEQV